MSSRPGAPKTAHIRARLQRGLRRNPPPDVRRSQQNTDREFRDTDMSTWLRLPEDIQASTKTSPTPSSSSDDNRTNARSEDDDELCALLSTLAEEFESKGRPYVAMSATAAIALIQAGRQDDINPGLWPYITQLENRREVENDNNAHPNKRAKTLQPK